MTPAQLSLEARAAIPVLYACTKCGGANYGCKCAGLNDCTIPLYDNRAAIDEHNHEGRKLMASLNLTQFIGNVGKIETKYLPSGEGVTNISLAVNDKYKNKSGELVEHTEWVRVAFFGKLSEVAEKYVKKGDPLYVSGQMKTRKWQDKDGQDRYTTEIRGSSLQMLGSKGERSEPAQRPSSHAPQQGGGSGFDDLSDEIPFATAGIGQDVIWRKLDRAREV